MGFLDKVKEQGSALASKAQEGISQGQAKLDESQARKKANGLLGELGAWQWAMSHGRDGGVGATEIERIRGELTAHEAEHGLIDPPVVAAPEPPPAPPTDQAPQPPPPPGAPPATPPGV
jgi:hypothetical protein